MIDGNISIAGFLNFLASEYGARAALIGRQGASWHSLTFQDLQSRSVAAAASLSARGIGKGDKVVLMAQSQPEFAVGFFAVALAGAVTVPLDVKLSVTDQACLVEFSDAVALVCLDEANGKAGRALAEKIPALANAVFLIGDLCRPVAATDARQIAPEPLGNDEVAVIAFTSGTGSAPKGVMLTWRHFLFQIDACRRAFPHRGQRRMLSILPLHHMLEFSAGLLNPLATGAEVYYANSMLPQQVLRFIHEKKITDMLVVPLFLQVLKKGIEVEVNASLATRMLFRGLFGMAIMIPVAAVRRFLFHRLHQELGGELRQFIVGAARMDHKVATFFARLGFPVYEGYGLTETSPIVATNHAGAVRMGTVGKPLEQVLVKLDPVDSAILVKGPNVMLGYYRNPEASAACLDENGWFNTGDIGKLDREGFLSIVGRSKDIIVLGNGKNVAPEEVEEFFKHIDFIDEICVVGMTARDGIHQGSEVVCAVVVLHARDTEPGEHYQALLQKVAAGLSYYKRPTRFIIQAQPLPKTSTLKTKRFLVRELLISQESTA